MKKFLSKRAVQGQLEAPGHHRGLAAPTHPAQDLFVGVHLREPLPDQWILHGTGSAGRRQHGRETRGLARAGDHLALGAQGRAGDPPTVADLAHDVVGGDTHTGEEHLVEMRHSLGLHQWADLDAGSRMSTMKKVIPRCFGASGSVRAIRMPKSACWALEVQTFWPSTTHSSPSRTARVASDARSEPAPGSLKSWHQHLLTGQQRLEIALLLLRRAVLHQRGSDQGLGRR